MLWKKAWIETRWRFWIGLVLLMLSAASSVLGYPHLVKLLPMVPDVELSGELGRQVREALELTRDYRSYIWSQWFLKNMSQLWLLFAALLGTGGLISQASGGGTLFTLSLPVSRNRLVSTRVVTGLAELFVLALVPALLISVLSPSIGHSYAVGDALIHGVCIFIAGSVFFSLAFLLSTVFSDVWRPWLIVVCAAIVLALFDQMVPGLSRYSVFDVMSAESYFRGNGLPWLGLLASTAVSVAMLYATAVNIAHRDF